MVTYLKGILQILASNGQIKQSDIVTDQKSVLQVSMRVSLTWREWMKNEVTNKVGG